MQATARKTAFPAPNKNCQHYPKQPLDRKSPIARALVWVAKRRIWKACQFRAGAHHAKRVAGKRAKPPRRAELRHRFVKNLVRTRLAGGGRRIRTLGPGVKRRLPREMKPSERINLGACPSNVCKDAILKFYCPIWGSGDANLSIMPVQVTHSFVLAITRTGS